MLQMTIACTVMLLAPPSTESGRSIVLDARFDDWDAVAPAVIDPEDAPQSFVDFGEVRITTDDVAVYWLIDFGRTVNVQGLDGTADIIFDADGNPNTGREVSGVRGADLIVRCTPPDARDPRRPGRGMAILSTTYAPDPLDVNRPELNPYDVGLAFAPTHSGRRIEFRLLRGKSESLLPRDALPALFVGETLVGKVVFRALDGTIADETAVFSLALPPLQAAAPTQPEQAEDPLARSSGAGAVRVVSWNGELGAIVSRPEPFVRTLRALQPDVILMQELTDKVSVQQVQQVLQHIGEPNRPWNVVLGKGGGDLRCAIFSRLPMNEPASLEVLAYPDRPNRSLRATCAYVEFADKKLLLASIHLKCCGRDGSPEDQTRLNEVEIIQNALRTEMADAGPAGLFVAGDFNLVGSRTIIENMMNGLDIDRSNLLEVDAYQLDRRSNATWSDRRQPFVPGRLDWAVYSDSSLQVNKSFVYDSADIAPRWHQHHSTGMSDSTLASDHLPIVVDLSWR